MLESAELLAATNAAYFAFLEREQPWRRDALCREPGYDVERFYPVRGAGAGVPCSICARCAVRAECEAYALAENIKDGIWGGRSGRDRRRDRAVAA